MEEIQYYLVTIGNIPIIDWLIRYEKLDPLLLLDNAIYHYALPASDQATKSRMCSIIQHILTDDKITNYFTLQDIQTLLHQFTNPKINEGYSLDFNNVRTILSFIDSVIQENWSKKLIELFHHTTNNPINNAEQISVSTLGSEEENLEAIH